MRRGTAIALGAGIAATLGLALSGALRGSEPIKPAVAPPTPVRAFVIGSATGDGAGVADAGESFAATIHRDREATLSFRLAGRVTQFAVREGQRLGAGAIVAAIDATPYRAAVTRQEADAARLGRAADRYGALAPDGAVSDAQARDARDVLSAARAGLTAARYDLASARLTMPFTGVVLSRRTEVGETVAPGQAVAMVADLSSPLVATAQVPVARVASLRTGMGAQVMVPGQAMPIAARVLRIGAASDARSGTVAVDLSLAGAGTMPSGTSASVRFAMQVPAGDAGADDRGEALVPAEAILDAQGQRAALYVIDGKGRARRTQVGFKGFSDRLARVSGLGAGARVITAGAGFVGDGDAVLVTAE